MTLPTFSDEATLKVLADANRLLDMVWDARHAHYLRGPLVAITLTPLPEEERKPRGVLLSFLPLLSEAGRLEGARVSLNPVEESRGIVRYGSLNHRGQVRFHDLEGEKYRVILDSPEKVGQT